MRIRDIDAGTYLKSSGGAHRSLTRLMRVQLVDEKRRPQPAQVDEFLFDATRYLYPPEFGGQSRGMPTLWALRH